MNIMDMDELLIGSTCRYCQESLIPCVNEGLKCSKCEKSVHVKCLKRGSVPGGIQGDLFYLFTCTDCNEDHRETFIRQHLSWLQAIVLALYHLRMKSGGLASNGFFHWRHHIVSFIDQNWTLLFPNEKTHKKKKWVGTVSGRLSHYSGYLFVSGSKTSFNKAAWWTLMYPRITPFVLSNIYNILALEKQKAKLKSEKKLISDAEQFKIILCEHIKDPNLTQTVDLSNNANIKFQNLEAVESEVEKKNNKSLKRKGNQYPENTRKLIKLAVKNSPHLKIDTPIYESTQTLPKLKLSEKQKKCTSEEPKRLLDPMCYYNTALNNISRMKSTYLTMKLTGVSRKEKILSPYSGSYLRPYIKRDTETFPDWLKMLAELQLVANKNNVGFRLPPRTSIDYMYVQPEHIPAVNSLCNLFFWPGIDMEESLQYPEFSCVAMYKRLVIGFAFLVPDVLHTENYMSFVFTRPGWRNCGIAKFMIYHLIQTSLGRDITLHVSMDNTALLLYQKFGFKVEGVVLDFYDKYIPSNRTESKHAYFCRLER